MQLTSRLSANILLAAAAVGVLAAPQTAKPLDIGDPAPALRPSRWLKGKPVKAFEKGQVYVVEFWATWCGPCRAAMPTLSAMARKYGSKVNFIGVDAFESTELAKVGSFVKSQGKTMDYRVAADGPGDRSGADWMRAAGEAGIPVSFVVDKSGRIAWIGHSPDDLDKVLPGVIAGKHDLGAERARRAASRNPHDAVTIAMGDRDYAKAMAIIDAEVAKHPESANSFALDSYMALSHFDVPRLRQRVRADIERTKGEFSIYNWATIALVWDGLSSDAYRLGLELIEEALPLSDMKLMLLARGAEIAGKAGDMRKAVDLQTQALAVAEATPNCSEERKADLRKDLERYKSGVTGA